MSYPQVLGERETVNLLHEGRSIARYGDGELRLAIGNECSSQRRAPGLREELCAILAGAGGKGLLVGIPNIPPCPKQENWARYAEARFTRLYTAKGYVSSFITRPDNAPWIDTPDYWASVRRLWVGHRVVLVRGDQKSLTPEAMLADGAVECVAVDGPRQHAYAEVDRIEAEALAACNRIARLPRVLLCLGAAATVLAARLHRNGFQALDLGHIGMFMRHAGAYRYTPDQLASRAYRAQLAKMHGAQDWGRDGAKHAAAVAAFFAELGARTILDYGCGRGALTEALSPQRVAQYDPGIPERAGLPKPADLVVCTDVLEHVEPERLDAVIDHIARLAGKAAFLVIATRPANAVLPDGRNAHLIVQPADWWMLRLHATRFREIQSEATDRELKVWLRK